MVGAIGDTMGSCLGTAEDALDVMGVVVAVDVGKGREDKAGTGDRGSMLRDREAGNGSICDFDCAVAGNGVDFAICNSKAAALIGSSAMALTSP